MFFLSCSLPEKNYHGYGTSLLRWSFCTHITSAPFSSCHNGVWSLSGARKMKSHGYSFIDGYGQGDHWTVIFSMDYFCFVKHSMVEPSMASNAQSTVTV